MLSQKQNMSMHRGERRTWKRIKKNGVLYLLFTPVIAYYVIFHYMPLGGLVIAFKNYSFIDGILGSPWAAENGLHHFIRFLTNDEFWQVFKNTLILASMRIFLTFPMPIILALMLNSVKNARYKKLLQTISYLPHFISFVVVYGFIYNFFSATGFINGVRNALGMQSLYFLSEPRYYRSLFVGSALWKEVGWNSIIYLAALSRVNLDLYEAAEIDGAGWLQKTWHITLTEIRPIISIQFVLTMGGILSVNFDQTMVMINPTVSKVAEVINYYVYRIGLKNINQFSYATAIGLFNSLISLAFVLITNYGAKWIDEDGGLW